MNVLVAVPYRVGTPGVFIDNICRMYTQLTWQRRELAMYPNDPMPDGRRYGGHARARNELIARALRAAHTHVLWVDVDLVRVPVDVIERLAEADAATDICEGGVIAAPFVFVEKLQGGMAASFTNGGWFYDTGGFVKDGAGFSFKEPYWKDYPSGMRGDVVELDSVGCCYLIPADVYRRGCIYAPKGDEVEHVSLMRQARRMGYTVLATAGVTVEHAFLPSYGVAWGTR